MRNETLLPSEAYSGTRSMFSKTPDDQKGTTGRVGEGYRRAQTPESGGFRRPLTTFAFFVSGASIR